MFTVRDVFERKTVAGLAVAARGAQAAAVAVEPEGGGIGRVPLTPVMRWVVEAGGLVDEFSQSVLVQVPAGLEWERLVAAVQVVLDRHDMLRAWLDRSGEPQSWSLRVPPPGAVSAGGVCRRVEVPAGGLGEILAREAAGVVGRLDPGAGVMVQVVWLDAGGGEPGRLLIAAHHLVVDGVSWRILVPDLSAAYEAAAGSGSGPGPAGTSFRAWAIRQEQQAAGAAVLAELPFWEGITAGPGLVLGDLRVVAGRDHSGTARSLTRVLGPGSTRPLLTTVPAVFRGGINDVLLAAVAAAVADWRGGDGRTGVLVNLEGHGRLEEQVFPGAELSSTVGWFTSIHPVRLDAGAFSAAEFYAGGAVTGAVVKTVKEQLRAVPGQGIGYGMLRYQNPGAAARLPVVTPLVLFNYLGRFAARPGTAWDTAPEPVPGSGTGPGVPASHAITVNAVTLDGADGPRLHITWTWPDALFTGQDIAALADRWIRAVEAVISHAAQPGAGGLTPSDLPLLALSQHDIDQLEAGSAADVIDVLPLSPLQEGLLFHALRDPDGADVYVVQLVLELAGPVDAGVLRVAAEGLLARHVNLRAGFRLVRSGPVQVIPRQVELAWAEVDLSGLEAGERDAGFGRWLDEDRVRRFDLARPPLIRFALVRLAPERFRLVITSHHILMDGWSAPLLVGELLELCRAGGDDSGLGPVTPYRDYLAWLAGRDLDAAEVAWRRALAGFGDAALLVPADPARPDVLPERVTVELTRELTAALAALARSCDLTMSTVVQGAWGWLLSVLTGRSDVVFGSTVAGRPRSCPVWRR